MAKPADIAERFSELLRELYQPLGLSVPESATSLQDGMRDYFNSQAPMSDANVERKISKTYFDFRDIIK